MAAFFKILNKFQLFICKICAVRIWQIKSATIEYPMRFKLNCDTKKTQFSRPKSPESKKYIQIFCYDFGGFRNCVILFEKNHAPITIIGSLKKKMRGLNKEGLAVF